MWHWDQGRLAYFQFDSIRKIASFVVSRDFKSASNEELFAATGLPFSPKSYNAWRNYSRVLKLCLLVSEIDDVAVATPTAQLLSQPGAVTCDEYFHYIARAFTEPSPALKDWRLDIPPRYPLLFALKYLLTKVAINRDVVASRQEIIGAYNLSGFEGSEDDESFIRLVSRSSEFEEHGAALARHKPNEDLLRQTNESLRVITQISYLQTKKTRLIASINPVDAQEIFQELKPILGPREQERNLEIQRLGKLFLDGYSDIPFDFSNTAIQEVVESGFIEGDRVKRTHLAIERNSGLRREFFLINPTSICDVCSLDTNKTYPWTERIIDLHHLLPLSSGTRVERSGTTFDDLVPVCPSCHRAIHRFYDRWLKAKKRKDFEDGHEAKAIYDEMKGEFPGVQYV